jgi:hypothetical protein
MSALVDETVLGPTPTPTTAPAPTPPANGFEAAIQAILDLIQRIIDALAK